MTTSLKHIEVIKKSGSGSEDKVRNLKLAGKSLHIVGTVFPDNEDITLVSQSMTADILAFDLQAKADSEDQALAIIMSIAPDAGATANWSEIESKLGAARGLDRHNDVSKLKALHQLLKVLLANLIEEYNFDHEQARGVASSLATSLSSGPAAATSVVLKLYSEIGLLYKLQQAVAVCLQRFPGWHR